jgi:hypothetical protein
MSLDEALAQYDKWSEATAYWLLQLTNTTENQEANMYSYYSSLKENFFNSIITDVMNNYELQITNYETLRFLFNYRNHYTDNLCIVETYLAESNFNEALETLAKMYEKFKLTKEQVNELTGLQIYVLWLQQLENEGKNIYELSEREVDYLVRYVESNTGRGVVFANIILCELYGICLEAESRMQNAEGEKGEVEKGEKENLRKSVESASSVCIKELDKITLVPNPTTGELTITNYKLGVGTLSVVEVEVFDVYGRKQSHVLRVTSNEINIAHLTAGIYFVRISTEAGEVVRKVVKQ